MLVEAFVVARKDQLRMQSLVKIVLTSDLIKANKKDAFKSLNAIKEFADKIIMEVVERYPSLAFLNPTRLENFFLAKNALSHVKSYAHKKGLGKFLKRKSHLLKEH
jgi:hypothetical protein